MTAPDAGINPVGASSGPTQIPPLLSVDDYATFSSLDVEWFTAAAGEVIRNYCQWHIAPSIEETVWCDVLGDGRIYLPTMYLTGVTSVKPTWPNAPTLHGFQWDQRGWVSFRNYGYGFGPNPANTDLAPIDTVRLFDAYPKHNKRMIVEFTHGYASLPYPVAAVASELAMRAIEKPAGAANKVSAGPYQFSFLELGLVLSEDQKNRLQPYAIPAGT